jgi:pilus assembly protein CpaB
MKQKNFVLMMVAVGCGLVAAFLTTQINAKPKVEKVEVLVAKKNLPVGTVFAKAEIGNLVEKKAVAKDALPPQFVQNEEDLYDKRLSRSTQKEEVINPSFLSKGSVVTLPDGKDMVSLSMSAVDAAGGFVGPGSKVDVLARLNVGNSLRVFPLLIDMHVLAVNTHTSYESKNGGAFPDVSMVSLAVTQEEALLLELAKQRGCHMALLLRHEGKPIDPNYDMKKIRKLLESVQSPTTFVQFEGRPGEIPGGIPGIGTGTHGDGAPGAPTVGTAPSTTPATPGMTPPDATAPSFKPELVKVWVAKEDIAPGTDLTGDLIKDKFTQKDYPKEYVEGAYTDLTPLLGKSFKYGVAKGQWVTDSLVGIFFKPSAQDNGIDNLPKPGPADAPATAPSPAKVGPVASKPQPKAIHDIAVHSASGTLIHRYMEMRPGEWKLVAILSPEQVAQIANKEAAAKEQAAPVTPVYEKDPSTQPNSKKAE